MQKETLDAGELAQQSRALAVCKGPRYNSQHPYGWRFTTNSGTRHACGTLTYMTYGKTLIHIKYIFKNAERTVFLGVALENLGQRLFPKKQNKTQKPTHMSPISYHEGQSGSAVRDGPSKPARKIPFFAL